MKKFAIPVSWTMTSMVTVEAKTAEDALELANKRLFDSDVPLPKTNAYYLDDSFQIDETSEISETKAMGSYAMSEITIHADGSVTT